MYIFSVNFSAVMEIRKMVTRRPIGKEASVPHSSTKEPDSPDS
jgi:hypothetical protein